MKNLDKYVLMAMLYIFGWSVAFFIAWIRMGAEPSILEGCILAPGAVELVLAAWIKQGKLKHEKIFEGDLENNDIELTELDSGGEG